MTTLPLIMTNLQRYFPFVFPLTLISSAAKRREETRRCFFLLSVFIRVFMGVPSVVHGKIFFLSRVLTMSPSMRDPGAAASPAPCAAGKNETFFSLKILIFKRIIV
jgi:hypothetical protein